MDTGHWSPILRSSERRVLQIFVIVLRHHHHEPNLRDAPTMVSEIVVDIYHTGASL